MIGMALDAQTGRLAEVRRPDPVPGRTEVLLRVVACGVCRTDLHVTDGDLGPRPEGRIPGHEVVGLVVARGEAVTDLELGMRVGVGWLGGACGACAYCGTGEENLCDAPQFTGWTRDGGFADLVTAEAAFCAPIPNKYSDLEAAPLMCAGLIGYRAWRKACAPRHVTRLGIYGFGAAGHLLAQLARYHGQSVYAFTRSGDSAAQALARDLGCVWAGGSDETPPDSLDAAILFAPVGELVPIALRAVRKGGTVVCGGIHMTDIPSFPYRILWEERQVSSIANLTRADAAAYLPLAAAAGVRPEVKAYPLADAQRALDDLRAGAFTGAAVLRPEPLSGLVRG